MLTNHRFLTVFFATNDCFRVAVSPSTPGRLRNLRKFEVATKSTLNALWSLKQYVYKYTGCRIFNSRNKNMRKAA